MTPTDTRTSRIPVTVQAEAAAWIARLHGTGRTDEDDQSFRRWLDANALHAKAFERMTELWEAAARLPSTVLEGQRHRQRKLVRSARAGWTRSLIAAAAFGCLVLAACWLAFHDPSFSTGIGERRTLLLADGSRLTLNTSTRAKVHFTRMQRRVVLESGEAFFEVAKQPERPFVVATDDGEVTALGTAFAVRHDHHSTEVTLLEGRVTVSAIAAARRESKPHQSLERSKNSSFVLAPGERLTLAPAAAPALDHPAVDKVTAWRQGLIAFEGTPLQEAVDEMNRYSAIKLEIEGSMGTQVEVSGVFHAGDSEELARALAATHGIGSKTIGNTILLSPPAHAQSAAQ